MKKIYQNRNGEIGEEGNLLSFLFIFFALFCLNSSALANPVVMHKIVYRHTSGRLDDTQKNGDVAKKINKKTVLSKSHPSLSPSYVKKNKAVHNNKGGKFLPDIVKLQNLKQEKYVFTADGKKDPFLPFFIEKDINFNMQSQKGLFPAETELERIKISDLKLVSVVKSQNNVWAMVRGPDGKGYILKEGVGIGTNGGRVSRIIWKSIMTPLGKKDIRKVVIREPVIKSNGKEKYKFLDMNFGDGSGDRQ